MKYLIRSVKYFIALCVIYVAVLSLMFATHTSALPPAETLTMLLHTTRGWLFIAAVVALAAFYPRFGFVSRRIEGDLTIHREQITNAFRATGFELTEQTDEELVFRAQGILRKLTMLFEDEIRVSQYGQWIILDGNRRGVARVQYKLESYIQTH